MAEKKYQNARPEFSYHLLRHALNDFSKNLAQLEPGERIKVRKKAGKSFELESLVLASPEAQGVVVSEQQLDRSVAEVASRYETREGFLSDLTANGLDEAGLRSALQRELIFDGVMQRVAADGEEVSDIDVQLFYEMHRNRFHKPERRVASHILITVNPDYPENSPEAARARMELVIEKLAGRADRFPEFAKRYSECPTAMEGGKLGEVSRGQLYPELDAALFGLEENRISPVIETEMGLHILLCERIKPGERMPFAKAAPRIRETLQQRCRLNRQRAWLADLRKKGASPNR